MSATRPGLEKRAEELRESFVEPHAVLKVLAIATVYLILPLAAFRPDVMPLSAGWIELLTRYNHLVRILFFASAMGNLTLAVTALMLSNYMDSSVETSRRWGTNVLLTGLFAFWILVKIVYNYELTQDPSKSKPVKLHDN